MAGPGAGASVAAGRAGCRRHVDVDDTDTRRCNGARQDPRQEQQQGARGTERCQGAVGHLVGPRLAQPVRAGWGAFDGGAACAICRGKWTRATLDRDKMRTPGARQRLEAPPAVPSATVGHQGPYPLLL